ncbi:MAG: hypothetical protein RBT20_00505 [Syntrophales bacterium]|jgi:hypothetical protein|nr:hypothetical protein [Syntrophales bacterium]
MMEELLNPRGVVRYDRKRIAPRVRNLDGGVLGLMDNSKSNADVFLDCVLEILKKRHSFADVLRMRKKAGSAPATFDQAFLSECTFVINAFGD